MRRVVVLGKGDLAIRVSEWFLDDAAHDLRCVVPVVPEPSWTGSLTGWAQARNVPIVASGRYQEIDEALGAHAEIDLAISVFYDKIIRQWFIDRCGRILNVHNSPLPRYRGVSPINWALRNGETEHGVSIHELEAGVDTGAVVAQVKYSIYPEFDEVIDVYERSLEYAWTLFVQTMPVLDRIAARPQDEAQATYYSRDMDAQLGERRFFTRAARLPGVSAQQEQ